MLLVLLAGARPPEARILEYRRLADEGGVEAAETLSGALVSEDDPAARIAARDALSRVDLTQDELLGVLEDSATSEARAWAAHSLGHYGGLTAAEGLLAAVDDPDDRVRAEVYEALGRNKDPRAVAVLQRAAVQDPSSDNRETAIVAAKRSLQDESVDVPIELARLAGSDPGARIQAAQALGGSEDWRAVTPLVAAAESGDVELRKASLLALGHLGDQRAVDPVREIAASSTGHVRYAAVAALAYLADESAIPTLVELCGDSDPSTRQLAVRALAWTDAPGTAAIIQPLLSDPSENVRAEVVLGLGEIADPERTAGLAEALGDPSPFVRAEAARLLGISGDTAGGTALVALLSDRDALVRISTAGAVADLGLTDAISPLEKLVSKTKDEDERGYYEAALKKLGG
ncbi:MAG TPA: HEAT repeat domain-containing protein [Myxococcota bacterium]|nr:HEAT repeat domain-containing protein [Myxococcota bacterium]